MKKHIFSLLLFFPIIGLTQNGTPAQPQVSWVVPSIENSAPFFSEEPSYNDNEQRALDVNRRILERELPSRPSETGGAVEFVYGQGMPVVICSPLRLCDIALEVGENVKDVMIGDNRWNVQPSLSGESPNHQIHAIVKPSDVGLVTSLMIATDRRVYNVTLKSSADKYMPQVSFTYPSSSTSRAWSSFIDQQESLAVAMKEEAMMIKAASAREEAEKTMRNNVPPRLGVDIDNISFDYNIKGNAPWRPLRVFDDGIHTYIELPDSALSDDIPVLLVSTTVGKSNEIVNYRFKDNRYVVDGLAQKITLVRDLGNRQQRVTITKNR